MASRRSRPRRLVLPILLSAVLVAEITGIALARSMSPADGVVGAGATSGSPATAPVQSVGRTGGTALSSAAIADASRDAVALNANAARVRTSSAPVGPSVQPASPARSTTTSTKSVASTSRETTRPATPSTTTTASYRGKNRVWIPSLGINRSVSAFPCSRTRPPDNYLYRWGCAGRNNVYLLGHAYSVFKPLHDAYVSGRLAKGMKVIHADGAGRVSTYSVIWWRVVKPTTAASWAWAAQSKPSMTLQTCVGARSDQRLMVRLVRVG
ncbi:MAG: sortase [Chloroflexota bacterium]|nr:sortase [Chloroflexota bacterium]